MKRISIALAFINHLRWLKTQNNQARFSCISIIFRSFVQFFAKFLQFLAISCNFLQFFAIFCNFFAIFLQFRAEIEKVAARGKSENRKIKFRSSKKNILFEFYFSRFFVSKMSLFLVSEIASLAKIWTKKVFFMNRDETLGKLFLLN